MTLPEAIKAMLTAKPGQHRHAIVAMRSALRTVEGQPKSRALPRDVKGGK